VYSDVGGLARAISLISDCRQAVHERPAMPTAFEVSSRSLIVNDVTRSASTDAYGGAEEVGTAARDQLAIREMTEERLLVIDPARTTSPRAVPAEPARRHGSQTTLPLGSSEVGDPGAQTPRDGQTLELAQLRSAQAPVVRRGQVNRALPPTRVAIAV